VRVLAATDIAARGIHVDDVELVIHVDPPSEHKAYLHRSGRTARAGAAGSVVTLVTPEQKRDVATLVRLAKVSPTSLSVRAGSEELRRLVGPAAPKVEAEAQVQATNQPGRTKSAAGRQPSRARSGRGQSSGQSNGAQKPAGQSRTGAGSDESQSRSAGSRNRNRRRRGGRGGSRTQAA